MEKKEKYNFDEIYEILTNFIDYTKECNYDLPELLYYLKFKLGIDCLEDFNNLEEMNLSESANFYTNDSVNDDGISEEEFYSFIFNEISEENQVVLNKLERVIKRYLKTGDIPDLYIECQKNKKLKLEKK